VARELAIDAVKRGAGECLVRAVYAPNVAEPLDVQVEMMGGEGRVREDELVLRPTIRHICPNTAELRIATGPWSPNTPKRPEELAGAIEAGT
jgi:hypothetical protein